MGNCLMNIIELLYITIVVIIKLQIYIIVLSKLLTYTGLFI